jgi:hypothetical protein
MVDRGSFDYYRDVFPHSELPSSEGGTPSQLHAALRETDRLLSDFAALEARVMNDGRLSAAGKREVLNEWVAENIPALAKRSASIHEAVERSTKTTYERAEEDLAIEAECKHGPEIRAWLAKKGPLERNDILRRQLANGDLSGARAVLDGPSYLSGIDDETTLADLREDTLRRVAPKRFERLDAITRGGGIAKMALSAATRAIEEIASAPIVTGSPPAPREAPKVVTPDPETQRRITEATEAAIARQEQTLRRPREACGLLAKACALGSPKSAPDGLDFAAFLVIGSAFSVSRPAPGDTTLTLHRGQRGIVNRRLFILIHSQHSVCCGRVEWIRINLRWKGCACCTRASRPV